VEKNKQELNGACFGKENINLKQIPASGATKITPVLQIQNAIKPHKVE